MFNKCDIDIFYVWYLHRNDKYQWKLILAPGLVLQYLKNNNGSFREASVILVIR